MTDASYINDQPTVQPLVGPGGYGLPPSNNNSYLQAMNRDSSQWGRPDLHLDRANEYPGVDPSPYMPRPSMFGQIMGNMGRTPWSGAGMQNATSMLYYWAAYYKAKRANRMDDARYQLAQAEIHSKKFLQVQAEEMQQQHDILSEAGAIGKNAQDPQKFRDRWNDYLAAHPDDVVLRNVLYNSSNPYTAVEALLKDRDTTWLTANKALAQRGKEDAPSMDAGDTGEDTTPPAAAPAQTQQQTTGQGPDTTTPPPTQTAASTPSQISGAPATTAAPATAQPAATPTVSSGTQPSPSPHPTADATQASPAQAPAQSTDSSPGAPAPNTLGNMFPNTTGIFNTDRSLVAGGRASEAHARSIVEGQTPDYGSIQNKQDRANVEATVGRINNKLTALMEDKNLKGVKLADALRATDAGFAEKAIRMAEFLDGSPTEGWGGRLSAVKGMLETFAQRLNPNYDPTKFESLKPFRDGKSQESLTMIYAKSVIPTLARTLKQIDAVEKRFGNKSLPANFIEQVSQNAIGLDSPYWPLAQSLRVFSQEAAKMFFPNAGTTAYRDILAGLKSYATPSELRSSLATESNSLDGRLEGYNDAFQAITGNKQVNSPFYSPETHDGFQTVSALDGPSNITTYKGKVPIEFKGIVRELPSGVEPTSVRRLSNGQWAYKDPKTGKLMSLE